MAGAFGGYSPSGFMSSMSGASAYGGASEQATANPTSSITTSGLPMGIEAIAAGQATAAAQVPNDTSQYSAADQELLRQYGLTIADLQPYIDAGNKALPMFSRMTLGNNQEVVDNILASDTYKTDTYNAQDAILQQASASGQLNSGMSAVGLGSVAAKGLQDELEERYKQLAGIVNLGQNAATGAGSIGTSTGSALSASILNQGATASQAALQEGQNTINNITTATNLFGGLAGLL